MVPVCLPSSFNFNSSSRFRLLRVLHYSSSAGAQGQGEGRGGDRATETLLGQPFIRLADKQAAALSNVKGSLVLLFYQSNKLEMFAATPLLPYLPSLSSLPSLLQELTKTQATKLTMLSSRLRINAMKLQTWVSSHMTWRERGMGEEGWLTGWLTAGCVLVTPGEMSSLLLDTQIEIVTLHIATLLGTLNSFSSKLFSFQKDFTDVAGIFTQQEADKVIKVSLSIQIQIQIHVYTNV